MKTPRSGRRPRGPAALLVLTAALLAAAAAAPAPAPWPAERPLRIGILLDSESETIAAITDQFEAQIRELLAGDVTVSFPRRRVLPPDAGLDEAAAEIRRLLAEPEVDLLITAGYVASVAACSLGDLPKPVLAPFALDAELRGLPRAPDGGSGVANLCYLSAPAIITLPADVLGRIVPLGRLAVMGPAVMFDDRAGDGHEPRARYAARGIEVVHVPLTGDVAASVEAIPADVDAVAVLTTTLTRAQVRDLAGRLVARRLPSFSFVGLDDVAAGFLAGMDTGEKIDRFARRVALNVQRILQGTPPEEIPVAFSIDASLVLNMGTARAIGVSPPWDVRLEADLIGDEPLPGTPHLDLRGAVAEVLRASPELAAARLEVEAGAHAVDLARAPLLPQAELGARAAWIDEDRAAASLGQQPERTYAGRAGLSQLLWSEDARAGLDAARHGQEARRADLDVRELDLVLEAATAYLDILRAQSLERIQRDNLRLSQSNLDKAEVRRNIGAAGPAEVYRWQAEIAGRRRDLIEANSRRNQAEIQLNRLRARPLEEDFELADVDLEDETLTVGDGWLERHVVDPVRFRRLRQYIVEEALAAAPELRALDALAAAARRRATAAGRAYWLPTVALAGSYERILDRGGAGAEGPYLDPATLPPEQLPAAQLFGSIFPGSPDDDNWSVGLSLSLPVFEGGGRRAEQLRARAEVMRLEREREAAALRVAQRARAAAHAAGASYAGIRHSRDAAAAAARTLEVVRDGYARGAADLLDLLDAQNAALVTDQVAANAVYDFLIDYLRVERAMGTFEMLLDDEARAARRARLFAFMSPGE